jgi:hypothetical protein
LKPIIGRIIMKKILFVITVILFVSVNTYSQTVVQSGTYFYSKESPNYTLNANQGKRIVEYEITFAKPFEKKPNVIIMPSLIDAESATQIRYNIRASGVSRDGFVLLAEVWGDTKFNSIGGFWLASAEMTPPPVIKAPEPEPVKEVAPEPKPAPAKKAARTKK